MAVSARIHAAARAACLAGAVAIGQIAAAAHAADHARLSDAITVSGRVEHTLRFTVQDLRAFAPQVEIALPPRTNTGTAKSATVRGVLLKDVLDKAGVIKQDHNDVKKTVVIAEASDGYKVVFSWSELFNTPVGEGVVVFIERDGRPLDEGEGRIALMSARDTRTGPRHVKWLSAIQVRKIVD